LRRPEKHIYEAAEFSRARKRPSPLTARPQSVSSGHGETRPHQPALASGQIGKPGAGPFSLTGQPNAMADGSRRMANPLSAHRDLGNEKHRREVAELWGVEEVPSKPGKTAVEMFEAVRAGRSSRLDRLHHPAQSLPDQKLVHER